MSWINMEMHKLIESRKVSTNEIYIRIVVDGTEYSGCLSRVSG